MRPVALFLRRAVVDFVPSDSRNVEFLLREERSISDSYTIYNTYSFQIFIVN